MFFRKYINNKYFYTGLLFLVWWVFFDQESLIVQYNLSRVKTGLENQKEFYNNEIKKDEAAINTLQNDTVFLEKYAREKYFMKKDDEDVFVVVRDDD
ncbi:MAG: septum formation initiator family protein [Bacteroidetes bacterium]|nr:septum formation initiator family protein [Bacteroidota bacterium]MBL6943676.1 septum formation initiator family protein [Bacteroidales bacterium]